MTYFSPLALTQTLPFLPLAQGNIDYEVDRRDDPDVLDRVLSLAGTRVILVRDGHLAVPREQGALVDYEAARMRLATLPADYVHRELQRFPQVTAIYLGRYHDERNQHVVAVDLTRLAATTPSSAADEDGARAIPNSLHEGADDAFAEADSDDDMGAERAREAARRRNSSLLVQAIRRFDWVDLRGFAPHASARQVGEATTAATLSVWHSRQRHCPACGSPVVPALAGWAQQCTSTADGQRILFARIEPAVITTIVDGRNRILLQHNQAWSDPRLYSVNAGFVEAGENLEHACRREALEETGLTIGEVRYLGSQPWPFPASLMVAFKAHALSTEIHVDGKETQTAQWFDHDEYLAALLSGRIAAPGKATIAHGMIEEWFGADLPHV